MIKRFLYFTVMVATLAGTARSDTLPLTDSAVVRSGGTDPDDPNSGFGIDGLPLPSTEKVQITWPSATGVLYRVWQSGNLIDWNIARDWPLPRPRRRIRSSSICRPPTASSRSR